MGLKGTEANLVKKSHCPFGEKVLILELLSGMCSHARNIFAYKYIFKIEYMHE